MKRINHFVFLSCLLLFFTCTRKASQELASSQGVDFKFDISGGGFNSKDHRGKVIFLFFGFLNCPYVCPRTLTNLHSFYKILPEGERQNFVSLFVSVDQQRDTLQLLEQRMKLFPPNFFGTTSSAEKLRLVMDQFDAKFKVIPSKVKGDYVIDHTSSVFVINPKGEWVATLNYDTPPEMFLEVFQRIDRLSPVASKHRGDRSILMRSEMTDCDLALGSCRTDDFEVTLSPLPLATDTKLKAIVRSLRAANSVPVEIDVQGIDLNMGLVRPNLTTKEKGLWEGGFTLPSCELSSMKWKATLITKENNQRFGHNFYFTTKGLK